MGDEVKLLGTEIYSNLRSDYNELLSSSFVCDAPGSVDFFLVYLKGNGAFHAGIYDSSRNLLADSGNVPCSTGWNAAPLVSPVSVAVGASYHLAVLYDSAACGYATIGGRTYRLAYSYGDLPEYLASPGVSFGATLSISAWGTLASGGAGRLIGGKSPLIGGRSPLIGSRSPLIG